MALVQVTERHGSVPRVPRGLTPLVELHLDDNQEIVAFKCEPHTMIYSDRKTEDWYWRAWVATRL